MRQLTLAYALGVKSGLNDAAAEENGGEEEEHRPLQHDDDIGEDVPFDLTQLVCEVIIRQVTPQVATLVKVQRWVHVRLRAWSGPFLEPAQHQNCHCMCSQAVLSIEAFYTPASGKLRAIWAKWSRAAAAGVLKVAML